MKCNDCGQNFVAVTLHLCAASDDQVLTALRARVAALEAALRDLMQGCSDPDEYARARAALEGEK